MRFSKGVNWSYSKALRSNVEWLKGGLGGRGFLNVLELVLGLNNWPNNYVPDYRREAETVAISHAY